MPFDTLLALAAEGDRQAIQEMAAKNPWIKEHLEEGERLKALRPKLKALHESYETNPDLALTELQSWHNWKTNEKDGWPVHQKSLANLQEHLATATARIAELEAKGDADVTPEEIKKIVTETLTAAGVSDRAALTVEMTKLIDDSVNPKINGLTSRFEEVFDKVVEVTDRHRSTFGESIRPQAIFEHMKKTGQSDPEKAYQEMVSPRLQEKSQKDWEAKVALAAKEGEEKGLRSAAAMSGRAVPVDNRGPLRMGPIQRRQMDRFSPKEGVATSPAPLGKGVIATTAAQAHHDKVLAGTSQ